MTTIFSSGHFELISLQTSVEFWKVALTIAKEE